jgi:hypothetical protein
MVREFVRDVDPHAPPKAAFSARSRPHSSHRIAISL